MLFLRHNSNQSPARVVITGAGIITALGKGWRSNAGGFRFGRCAIRPVTRFDVSCQRTKLAAEAELPAHLPETALKPKPAARMDRAARLLLHAAHEAWSQAHWQPSESLPLVLGTTSCGMTLGQEFLRQTLATPAANRLQASRIVHYHAQQQALNLGDAFEFHGPITIISNACASGANALGHAFELIRSRQAERVFAGGYDALCQLTFAGFDALQALSPTPCRPFDAQRTGLSLGEGAAMLTLESLEHAQRCDASILAEIIGYGAATDIHHLTQPHPQGDAAFAAMNAACRVGRLTPGEVDYVNAHGTATPQNDATEAAAINRWAGQQAAKLPVSSTKSSIGHLLGAAGAVEAVVCLMTLREQWLPPQANLDQPDPACSFQLVRQPATRPINVVLSNSFGFGGANATLAFRRWI